MSDGRHDYGAPVDVGHRDVTEVVATYALDTRIEPGFLPSTSLDEHLDFGRFTRNIVASAALLPRVACSWDLAGAALGFGDRPESWPSVDGRLLLLVTPRGDLTLILRTLLPEGLDASDIARFLAATCFGRDSMSIDGRLLTDWVCEEVVTYSDAALPPLAFGRDVHQCVLPGGRLLAGILEASEEPECWTSSPVLGTIVSRGTIKQGLARPSAPESLNNPGTTLGVLVRGVSVLAGWSPPAENVMLVVPSLIVTALAVLKRSRTAAFDALTVAQESPSRTAVEARNLITDLSNSLNDIQLDLSFGVEAYVDSVLIPELYFESFQVSLREASGLAEGLTNTSRMIERVSSVMRARSVALDAAVADQTDQRVRTISNVVAAGSILAFPPALLLAFFGVNSPDVDPATSILDLRRYWAPYVLAFLPFAGLVAFGYLRFMQSRLTNPLGRRSGRPASRRH